MNSFKAASVLLSTALVLTAAQPAFAAKPKPAQTSASKAAYSPVYKENSIGAMKTVRASYEDTLVHIGRDFDVGFVEMRAANPSLDPWIPGEGAEVIIPTLHLLPDAPRKEIVINLAEMRMYYYKLPGMAPQTYPIGIGRDGLLTPVGSTTVTHKKVAPTWTPTARMRKDDPTLPAVVQPGPDNPMGTHALYLGFPTIRIHGTNKPYGIGRRVSSGCIRMFPEDIGRLFVQVPVGTTVTVVDQPIKAAWIGDEFFMEVHPTQDQATAMETEGEVPNYEMTERDMAYVMRKAGPRASKLDWAAIRRVVKERRGFPVVIARGSGENVANTVTPPVQPKPKLTNVPELKDGPVAAPTPVKRQGVTPVHGHSNSSTPHRISGPPPFYRN